MTPGKLQKILQGQTALARKVFEVVPIKEAWPASQIRHSLKEVERSNADLHTVRGCLATLREIGLVREPEPGCFQRHAVRTPQPTPKKEVITMQKAAVAPQIAQPAAPASATPASKSPLEILGNLSSQIAALADDFSTRLKQLAAQVEEAALTIEQEQEGNAQSLEKLKQLQSILKSL